MNHEIVINTSEQQSLKVLESCLSCLLYQKDQRTRRCLFGACSVIVSCLRELRKGDGKVSGIRAAWDIPSAMAFSVSDLSSTCPLVLFPESK